jgi:hypothetical protein
MLRGPAVSTGLQFSSRHACKPCTTIEEVVAGRQVSVWSLGTGSGGGGGLPTDLRQVAALSLFGGEAVGSVVWVPVPANNSALVVGNGVNNQLRLVLLDGGTLRTLQTLLLDSSMGQARIPEWGCRAHLAGADASRFDVLTSAAPSSTRGVREGPFRG